MDLILGTRDGVAHHPERGPVSVKVPFGISVADRRRHLYVLGKSGSGKSTLLRNLAAQDIAAGRGLMLLDPHGDLAEELLDYIPSHRIEDVIYLDPADLAWPIGFNLLERVAPDDRPLVAASVVATFKHLWRDSWGPRLEYVLYNTVAALLDYPASRGGVSLLGVPRVFTDLDYRERVVREIRDERVRAFWAEEFAAYTPSTVAEVVSPIQNKVGAVLAAPAVRNMVGQATSTLKIGEAMDERRIIIANLAKGRLGETACNLLGSLLVTAVQMAAMRRTAIPEEERVDFVAYLDEFHNFTTDAFAAMLAEARKYRLGITAANQYLRQITPEVRAAVFGNVGTLVSFQLGHDDAEEIAGEFAPYRAERLTELSRGEVCVRTVAGGMTAPPFHGSTIAEVGWGYRNRDKVLAQSRQRWGRRREEVEAKLTRWGARPETPPAPKRTRERRPSMVVNIENFYGGEAEPLE
jgi:energy-coupling factor transporter ATP-binding protein EcfA2